MTSPFKILASWEWRRHPERINCHMTRPIGKIAVCRGWQLRLSKDSGQWKGNFTLPVTQCKRSCQAWFLFSNLKWQKRRIYSCKLSSDFHVCAVCACARKKKQKRYFVRLSIWSGKKPAVTVLNSTFSTACTPFLDESQWSWICSTLSGSTPPHLPWAPSQFRLSLTWINSINTCPISNTSNM